MAESNGNNQANVSSAKGVKGGYIFSAPEGTALPTDIKTPSTRHSSASASSARTATSRQWTRTPTTSPT